MEAGIGGKYTFSDGTPMHICIHFIFIANKCSGLHFPSNDIFDEIFMVGAGIFVHFGDEGVSAVQGHPRSLTLVPIESAYATSY